MKCLFAFLFILGFTTCLRSVSAEDEEPQCGIKTCVMEILNLGDISFGSLIKKMHTVVFCIRECSPPVVHEFFQSLSYALTNRIVGHCSGKACIETNRFVALGHCMENRSWPLLQCGLKIVDLAQLALEPIKPEEYRNKTCNIIIQSINCFQKNIEKCGPKPYSLLEDHLDKAVSMAFRFFCRVYYNKDGNVAMITEETTEAGPSTTPREPALFPPVAKGYKSFDPNSSVRTSMSSLYLIIPLVAVFWNIMRLHTL